MNRGHMLNIPEGEGLTIVAGLAGSGKTYTAEQLTAATQKSGRPAVYYRMIPDNKWLDIIQRVAFDLGVSSVNPTGLGHMLHALPTSDPVMIVFDDYLNRPTRGHPKYIREQIAGHSAQVVVFGLPDWRMPADITLQPLPESERVGLGSWDKLTGGWAAAVTVMKEVLADDTVPETLREEEFYDRMNDLRSKRMYGKRRVGRTGYEYLCAMLKAGDGGPVPVSKIAEIMDRSLSSCGPYRSTLLKSGVIYSPKLGYLDFSDPLHADSLRRDLQRKSSDDSQETNSPQP